MLDGKWRAAWRAQRHWVAIVALLGVAVWHAIDFRDTPDADFPQVIRPHFSTHPPAAYRLAEPGDTLDRIGLYFAAAALVLSLVALVRVAWCRRHGQRKSSELWPLALVLGAAGTWYAATPGPTFDGWHGVGWRTIFNPLAPLGARMALASAGLALGVIGAGNIVRVWPVRRQLWAMARQARVVVLLGLALVLVSLRQVVIPGLEPAGYWPRVAFDLGMLAFALALLRLHPGGSTPLPVRRKIGAALGWGIVVAAGIMVAKYHRPLARLHAVVPERIYISAMPTYRGLAIEQQRLGFKTIINLFDEASTQASPLHTDEIRFVRERGLRYLGSPSDGLESDKFLSETLALAEDPDAWPILVHCHGCMDRSPAWMGMYRFLVEKKPLADIYREIEQHRGTRPKAVVTLQYNRKLRKRAPEQFANDPTGRILQACVKGVTDPFHLLDWNPTRTHRQVVRRIDPQPALER